MAYAATTVCSPVKLLYHTIEKNVVQSYKGPVRALLAGSASRTTYGNNALSVDFDNEAISRNYQDVDIQLLSPAFLSPETIPAGFGNGTSGPTPLHELGM